MVPNQSLMLEHDVQIVRIRGFIPCVSQVIEHDINTGWVKGSSQLKTLWNIPHLADPFNQKGVIQ